MPDPEIPLRDTKDSLGRRTLAARVRENGDLELDGWDFGDGVERVLGPGCREHEWIWTVRSADVPHLARALGVERGSLLEGLRVRFSGDRAAHVREFLEANDIPCETTWSRIGD